MVRDKRRIKILPAPQGVLTGLIVLLGFFFWVTRTKNVPGTSQIPGTQEEKSPRHLGGAGDLETALRGIAS